MRVSVVLGALVAVLGIYAAVFGFTEPAGAPPLGNVAAPVTVGPEAQSKAGDLELENLKARGAITLGGVARNTWPAGTGGTCSWEGRRCYCASNDSSVGSMQIVIGMTCSQGRVTDFKVVNFEISSKSKSCPSSPPAGCTEGLYLKN